MTPVEIATQITSLYGNLKTALANQDSEWSGDYQALLSELADAQTAAAEAMGQVTENSHAMDGDDWEEVADAADDAASDLRSLAGILQSAANHAEAGQDWLAQTA